jgi:hypothetical protein
VKERIDFEVALQFHQEAKQISINALSKKTGRSRGGLVKTIDRIDWTGDFVKNLVMIIKEIPPLTDIQAKGLERTLHCWMYHSDFSMAELTNKKLKSLVDLTKSNCENDM